MTTRSLEERERKKKVSTMWNRKSNGLPPYTVPAARKRPKMSHRWEFQVVYFLRLMFSNPVGTIVNDLDDALANNFAQILYIYFFHYEATWTATLDHQDRRSSSSLLGLGGHGAMSRFVLWPNQITISLRHWCRWRPLFNDCHVHLSLAFADGQD